MPQFKLHVVFAVGLVVVGMFVAAAEEAGGLGSTQAVRQFAAWALQVIMQVVTVEVCASRIFPQRTRSVRPR